MLAVSGELSAAESWAAALGTGRRASERGDGFGFLPWESWVCFQLQGLASPGRCVRYVWKWSADLRRTGNSSSPAFAAQVCLFVGGRFFWEERSPELKAAIYLKKKKNQNLLFLHFKVEKLPKLQKTSKHLNVFPSFPSCLSELDLKHAENISVPDLLKVSIID